MAALEACARAVAAAESADIPWLRVQALYFTGVVHQYRRDAAKAAQFAERLLAIAEEHEFRYWILLGRVLRGWCRERLGAGGGIDEIEAAILGLERLGTVIGRPYFLAHLAEVRLAAGDVAAAEGAIERAFAVSDATVERLWRPSSTGCAGEIVLARAAAAAARRRDRLREEAAASFDRARDLAREQGAPALELRALLAIHELDPARRAGARR